MATKTSQRLGGVDYSGTANLALMDHARRYNAYLAAAIERCWPENALQAVDLGAGVGTIARRFPRGRVTCVELDPQLRAQLVEDGFPCFEALAHVPHTIHYLFSLNVLEHVADDRELLCGIFDALAPGARLLLYLPAFHCLFSKMDRLVGHFRRYTIRELTSKLESAGFRHIDAHYVDPLGFCATAAYKTLGLSGHLSESSVRLYDSLVFPASLCLQPVTKRLLGKNVLVTACRKG